MEGRGREGKGCGSIDLTEYGLLTSGSFFDGWMDGWMDDGASG